MKLFPFLGRLLNKTPEQELPWQKGEPIFAHIKKNLDQKGKLAKRGYDLPDENRRFKGDELQWIPGALDNVLAHHGGTKANEIAEKVARLVKEVSKNNSLRSKILLYTTLEEHGVIGIIDPAIKKIVELRTPREPYLHNFARWLAFESPNREAVKFGIALLGLCRDTNDLENIKTLGKHEEFTLYVAVALSNMLENPENELWSLAQLVDGWGKINLVERLDKTQNPQIKRWMLREGYKNAVMYEYLAYICAVTGNLREELNKEKIDDALLDSSGDIIDALLHGGPAKDINDYSYAAEVISSYVRHMQNQAEKLNYLITLYNIKNYLEDKKTNWDERKKNGWTDGLRIRLLNDIHQIMGDLQWRERVQKGKDTKDDVEFWSVSRSAEILGIDLWETYWSRLLENTGDSIAWYRVMKCANNERIGEIVELAVAELPLEEIASGPKDSLGSGSEYRFHRCLDFILQDLKAYPGHGYELIKKGLQSPVTRNRNMAIFALAAWGKENWEADTVDLLKEAYKVEPNIHTKENLRRLIDNSPLKQ